MELGTALPLTGINIGCGILVCKNGEIFVGSSNGMATFFEQQLFNSAKDYQLYFSDPCSLTTNKFLPATTTRCWPPPYLSLEK